MKVDLQECIVIMEHTGVYTLQLMCFLDQNNIDFALFPGLEIKRSLGIKRGKNDKVDARRIADYGFHIRHKLKASTMPTADMLKLKQLQTTRLLFVKNRTSLKNCLKAQQTLIIQTQMTITCDELSKQIKTLDESIAVIEEQMIAVVAACPSLKKNFDLLCSVKGVGAVIAYAMIICTNNFSAFPSARHFMSYAGVAPFDHESGQYKSKRRICSLANKHIKSLLHNGVCSAITHDPEIKAYYQRKLEQGKPKAQVANAIAGKLISRVFAVIKRGTPFIITYSQKINQIKVA
jgi:transposase